MPVTDNVMEMILKFIELNTLEDIETTTIIVAHDAGCVDEKCNCEPEFQTISKYEPESSSEHITLLDATDSRIIEAIERKRDGDTRESS